MDILIGERIDAAHWISSLWMLYWGFEVSKSGGIARVVPT
jgi:hypothetical protein